MWVKLLVSALVFYAFIPGVLVTLRTPFTDANVTHAILYAVTAKLIMTALKPLTKA
jgi:hypothetical protein